MKCLHGEPAAQSTTQNGTFWYCNQNPGCNFVCSAEESYLYEKAIFAWRVTEQLHPRCAEHNRLAGMHVVKDLMKANYGRPFFRCSDKKKPCSFWMWGDVHPIAKPECRHGLSCAIRKVKKEGLNKDREFFCCPNDKESSCKYFDWVPEEPYEDISLAESPPGKSAGKHEEHHMTNKFINNFASSLDI